MSYKLNFLEMCRHTQSLSRALLHIKTLYAKHEHRQAIVSECEYKPQRTYASTRDTITQGIGIEQLWMRLANNG